MVRSVFMVGGTAETNLASGCGRTYVPDMNGVTEIRPDWLAEFEAAARRPLAQRFRYAFVRTYKPVLDDARFRSFDSMEAYRQWCEANLPDWLGYGRV